MALDVARILLKPVSMLEVTTDTVHIVWKEKFRTDELRAEFRFCFNAVSSSILENNNSELFEQFTLCIKKYIPPLKFKLSANSCI